MTIENLGGGGEVKLSYYAMKGSRGTVPPKKLKTKVERNQRPKQNGCLWF